MTGAFSSVNCRSSSAWRTAASCAATEASATRLACVRCSKVCSVMVRSRTSCEARARSLSVKARLARACASVARACASDVSNGRRSMVNSRSPCLTICAVLEMDLVEIAGDARADLDRVDRDEAADILVVVGHGLLGAAWRR